MWVKIFKEGRGGEENSLEEKDTHHYLESTPGGVVEKLGTDVSFVVMSPSLFMQTIWAYMASPGSQARRGQTRFVFLSYAPYELLMILGGHRTF